MNEIQHLLASPLLRSYEISLPFVIPKSSYTYHTHVHAQEQAGDGGECASTPAYPRLPGVID